jgi:hypothetical protein
MERVGTIKPENDNGIKVECQLVNRNNISIPQWYLTFQGHDLEGSLKSIFQPLKKFQREGDLKKDIIRKVFDDLPGIVSNDFSNLFESIRNG